ncbi:MAG: endonuclease III [Halobacteria archaeon]
MAPAPHPRHVERVFASLRRRFRGSTTTLGAVREAEPEEPFKVLIATILSQRTRDENTERAARALFARYATPEAIESAPPSELGRLIRPAGFYNQKSRVLREVCRVLRERHGGRVPPSLEELLALPGVGRKTANCVLVYGFGKPAIPVDTHVHRISNRLNWVRTRTPEETEDALVASIPRRYWLDLNELFVRFGQEVCRPVGPRCGECDFTWCPSRTHFVRAGSP